MIIISTLDFQKSITNELDVIKNRVRYLIGDHNWAEEGRYKEAILRNIIKCFLPQNLSIGNGFILHENRSTENSMNVSNQIDILIYDNKHPLLFKESDFIITTPLSVKAIIEVKTTIKQSEIKGMLTKLKKTKEIFSSYEKEKRNLFVGLFGYSYDNEMNLIDGKEEAINRLKNSFQDYNGVVNHVSLGKDIFIKYWEEGPSFSNCEFKRNYYAIYKLIDLSFSYFISNLINYVTKYINYKPPNDRIEDLFRFPILGSKESKLIDCFQIDS